MRDADGKIVDMILEELNEQANNAHSTNLQGKPLSAILEKPHLQKFIEAVEYVQKTKESIRLDSIPFQDRTYSITLVELDDDRIISLSIDITNTFLQEIKEKRDLAETRTILEAIPLQLWSSAADGMWATVNSNWQKYTGRSVEEALGIGWLNWLHNDDRERVLRSWRLSLDSQQAMEQNARILSAGGEYRWFSIKALPVRNQTGPAQKWYGVNVDIHEQKMVEERLANVNQMFQEIAANISECFWVVDPRDGSLIYNSPSFKKILGYTPEERQKLPGGYQDIVHPEDWHIVAAAQQDEIQGKETNIQYRVVWPDSSVHWVNEIGRPITDPDGMIRRVVGSIWDVSTEVESLRQLKQSENQFKMLTENIEEGFWMAATTNELLYISPAIGHIFGKPVEEFRGLADFTKLIHPDDQLTVQKAVASQVQGKTSNINFRVLRPDGRIVWVWDRSFPIYSEITNTYYTAGVIADITEQKMVELQMEELNRSLELRIIERTAELQDLYDNAPVGYHSLDNKGNFLRVNRTEMEWLGYTEEEMLKMNFRQLLTETSQAFFDSEFSKFLYTKSARDLEFEVVSKDGTIHQVMINAKAESDESDQFVHSYSTMLDITNLKKAQNEVIQNSEKFQSLFDNSIDSIFLRSYDTGELIDANRSALNLLGYTLEELKKIQVQDLILEVNNLDGFHTFAKQLTASKKVPPNVRTYICKNGAQIRLEVSYSLISDQYQVPIMIQYVCRDLTERTKAEEEIRKERDFARAVMNSVSIGLSVIDTKGMVEYLNPTMCSFLGVELEEAQKEPFVKCFAPESLEIVKAEHAKRMTTHQPSRFEVNMIRHDGAIRTMFMHSTPRVENGVMTGSITSFMDITAEKEIENNLRLSRDQMASVNSELEKAVRVKDEFLSSVTHELRTPLTGILGLSEVLLAGNFGPFNEKQTATLQNIVSSGRHLQDLINDILDLSRIEAGKLEIYPELCVVDDLCRSSVRMVESISNKKKQTIEISIDQPSLKIFADLKRMKQVLVNLFSNAIKFTPDGGKIGVHVEVMAGENRVKFTVWDSGIGINPEDQERIFLPFTQLDSRLGRQFSGTGLGLALVEKFITLHNGTLSVQSEVGKGSSFIFTLPWQADEESRLLEAAYNQKETQANTGFLRTAILAGNFSKVDNKFAVQLRAIGLRVHQATTMQEVLNYYDRKASMIVFTLYNEPLEENKLWLNALLDEPHFKELNVVVMHPTPETLRQPATAGVVHLSIPIQINELRAKMEDIFGNTINGIGGITTGSQAITPKVKAEKKTTLLVVEDNLINREMLIDYLITKDFEIIAATNGVEAVEKTVQYRPDLILMDIQMPIMDGMEATRQIRANSDPQIADIPILAVTALAMVGDRERILAAGCNDYVSKPIILPVLVEKIYKTIKNNIANAN